VLRFDITTNDWVIFAPRRALRPYDFDQHSKAQLLENDKACPFCPGNEQLTPPEVFAVREGTAPNSRGWRVRVTPNKFPALRIEEDVHRRQTGRLFSHMGGCAHLMTTVPRSALPCTTHRMAAIFTPMNPRTFSPQGPII